LPSFGVFCLIPWVLVGRNLPTLMGLLPVLRVSGPAQLAAIRTDYSAIEQGEPAVCRTRREMRREAKAFNGLNGVQKTSATFLS